MGEGSAWWLGCGGHRSCVHKCEVTHAHTRAWPPAGREEPSGPQPGGQRGPWDQDQGLARMSYFLFLSSLESCWQAALLGPFAGELSCHRALRADGYGRGPDASEGRRRLETPWGSPCRAGCPASSGSPPASWRQPATGKERAAVATRSGSRLWDLFSDFRHLHLSNDLK